MLFLLLDLVLDIVAHVPVPLLLKSAFINGVHFGFECLDFLILWLIIRGVNKK